MKKRIMVAGSANTDVIISLDRVPDGGESVLISSQNHVAGGKGTNRAVTLARLGANPLFSCCLGDDSYGKELFSLYQNENMDTSEMTLIKDTDSGTAYIFLEKTAQNRIAIYSGANACFGKEKVEKTISRFDEVSVLCTEFEIPPESVERLNYEAVRKEIISIIDTAPIKENLDKNILKGAFIISPNETEAKALTGITLEKENDIKDACKILYSYGVKNVIIKLGSKGSVCYDGNDFTFCNAVNIGKVIDTTAAGDCYMGALCYAISLNYPIEKAMRFASTASGIAVTRLGAVPSLPNINEVRNYFN